MVNRPGRSSSGRRLAPKRSRRDCASSASRPSSLDASFDATSSRDRACHGVSSISSGSGDDVSRSDKFARDPFVPVVRIHAPFAGAGVLVGIQCGMQDELVGIRRQHRSCHRAYLPLAAFQAALPDNLGARRIEVVVERGILLDRAAFDFEVDIVEAVSAAIIDDFQFRGVQRKIAVHQPVVVLGIEQRDVCARRTLGLAEIGQFGICIARFALRQKKRAALGMNVQPHRFRRRPGQRPVRSGHRKADLVAFREHVGDAVEFDAHPVAFSRFQFARFLAAVAVGEIEQAVRHARDLVVGGHVGEAYGDHGDFLFGGNFEIDARRAHDLEALVEPLALEHQRAAVFLPLVVGQVRTGRIRAPFAGEQAYRKRRLNRVPEGFGIQFGIDQPIARQVIGAFADSCAGPPVLGHPASGPLAVISGRRHAVLHPDAQHGLVFDAGVLALEPVIPPVQQFPEEIDRGAGNALVGILVAPRADEPLARNVQIAHQAENGVRISIRPAADRKDRALDGRIVLAHRTVRPVVEDYSAIKCPVFSVSGWADGYSNAVFRLMRNLDVPRKGLIGPWSHKYPHQGVPGPAINFLRELLNWWDHWLKGKDTGVEDEPMLRVWMQDSVPPTTYYSKRPGRWVAEDRWPSARIRERTYNLSRYRLVDPELDAEPFRHTVQSPLSVGLFAGKWCSYAAGPDLAHDQRQEDGGSLVFQSERLDEGFEIMGAPSVDLEISTEQEIAMVAVRLSDVAPDDKVTRVTYGLLNLTHRYGSEEPRKLEPGKRYRVRVELNGIAHMFPKGHKVRLSVSTSYWPLAWPPPKPVRLNVHTEGCSLFLPEREPRDADAELPDLGEPEGAPGADITLLDPEHHNWLVHRDLALDASELEVIDDRGRHRLDDIDLEIECSAVEKYSSLDDDFDSARAEVVWERSLKRGEWKIRTVTRTVLTASPEEFILYATLDAYEWSSSGEKRVFSNNWDERIPRELV